jgi:4-amino-4-deoxy-L-arabinose transferase-like glycosyltransferase
MERSWESKLLKWFLAFLLVAFLINLGTFVLIHEEPRRGIITFEMLKNHNFFQPTVLTVPYFKKPPFHEWVTALFSALAGSVNEFTLRLPSALAVLATAATLYFLGRRLIHERAALFGALIYSTFFVVLIGYGTKCEPDSLFTFLLTVATFGWFYLFEKGRQLSAWFVGYLFTSFALLTKGLPALEFFYTFIFSYFLVKKRWRELPTKEHLLGAAAGCLPFLFWITKVNWEKAVETLFSEVLARAPSQVPLSKTVKRYLTYPVRLIGATFPWSLVLIYKLKKEGLKPVLSNDNLKVLGLFFLINALLYWAFPGTRLRYLMPALPALALITGYYLQESKVLHKRAKEIVKFTAQIIVLLGIVAGVVATKNPSLTLQCTVTFLLFLYALYFLFIPRFNFTYSALLIALLMLILRGFYSSYYYPIAQFKYPKVRETAKEIGQLTKNYPLYTKTTYLQLCFYVEEARDAVLPYSPKPPAKALFLSQRREGHVLKEFKLGKHRFFLCSYGVSSLKPQGNGERSGRQVPEKRNGSSGKGEFRRG